MKTRFFLASTAFFALPALAQEPTATPSANPASNASQESETETVVVVTDTKTTKPIGDSTASISVITSEQIEAREALSVTDLLRTLPGVTIAQAGTLGKSTSVFTRGTNSNHTLVLVDGVRVNNPNDGRYDFGQFPVENIERIEVLRGPASALYGSDAIGGVINIISKRGNGEPKIGGSIEFGNYSSNRQTINYGGQSGKSRFAISGFRIDTAGNFENDDYNNNGFAARYERELSAKQTLAFTSRLNKSKYGTPGQRYLGFDPLQNGENRDIFTSLSWTNRVGKRSDLIRFGLTDHDFIDDDTANSGPLDPPEKSHFREQVQSLEAQTSYNFGQSQLTAGLETRREKSKVASAYGGFEFGDDVFPGGVSRYNSKTRTNALFVQNEYKTGKLTLTPGIRYEDNSQFGDFTSYRLASAYALSSKTRLKGSYGTAFKAPTFANLYFPDFSNPDLQPERSKGYEVGVSQSTWDNGNIEVTYFNNRVRDLIGFAPGASAPTNINTAKTNGYEVSLNQPLGKGFTLFASHTRLSVDSSSGHLLRRPKFNTSINLLARRDQTTLDFGFVAQGERYDSDFVTEFSPVKYGGFGVFNATLGYDLRLGLQLYARAGNLFNRQYEEIAGFPAPKFNIAIGLKATSF
jgi:vitamin B12 transporter